jgi:hypothetical protein
MGCCCGCSTNCDNTTDWNGRCCDWESFPAEMSNMFDGLVVNFGPTNIELAPNRWRSEIIDLPGSYITSLQCNFVPIGGIGITSVVTGTINLGLSFSGFKLALHRTDTGNAACLQTYNMWFGMSFSVSAINSINAVIRNQSGTEIWSTTNPAHISLANGSALAGHSVVRPCDGSNNAAPGYGALASTPFGGPGGHGVNTTDCDAEMPLRFGWATPVSINARINPDTIFVSQALAFINVPTWIGCGVQGFYSGGPFLQGVTPNSTKLPMTVKRSTSWGECENIAVNVNAQPNIGLQLNRGLAI